MTSNPPNTSKIHNPIVLIEFDHVLHDGVMREGDPIRIPGKPFPGALVWLTRLTENQDSINSVRPVIYSRFSGLKGGRQAMKNWLFNHGFPGSILEELIFSSTKPDAIMTIDAKAFRFEGEYPSTKTIRATQIWSDPNRAYYWAGTELVQAYLVEPKNLNPERFPHWLHKIAHLQSDQYQVSLDFKTLSVRMGYYIVKRSNNEYYVVGQSEFNLSHVPSHIDEAHLHIARLKAAQLQYELTPTDHCLNVLLDVTRTVTNRLG